MESEQKVDVQAILEGPDEYMERLAQEWVPLSRFDDRTDYDVDRHCAIYKRLERAARENTIRSFRVNKRICIHRDDARRLLEREAQAQLKLAQLKPSARREESLRQEIATLRAGMQELSQSLMRVLNRESLKEPDTDPWRPHDFGNGAE